MLVHRLPACTITQHKLPLLRAHGHLSHPWHIFIVQYRRREPATPARFPSIRVKFLRREHAPRAPFPSATVQVRRRDPVPTAPFLAEKMSSASLKLQQEPRDPWMLSRAKHYLPMCKIPGHSVRHLNLFRPPSATATNVLRRFQENRTCSA